MTTIERSIEVRRPASECYRAWTQFERFPEFMSDVKDVRQLDDTHLHWRANFWGQAEEWDAEITEQIPDKRIAWRSEGGAGNSGAVTFHRLSDGEARVMVQMEYHPETLMERIADWIGVASRRVERDLEAFKGFVEAGGAPDDGGWRGAVAAKPDAAQQR